MSTTPGDEWVTPPWLLGLAREVLGSIELDPASSPEAQSEVLAERYLTREEDALADEHVWSGKVWLNPPYSRGLVQQFTQRLVSSSRVTEALCLTNAAVGSAWWHELVERSSSVALLRRRVRFLDPGTGLPWASPRQGQSLCYLGGAVHQFRRVLGPVATVLS
jgi:phage N-6-adenine-methyltransferase